MPLELVSPGMQTEEEIKKSQTSDSAVINQPQDGAASPGVAQAGRQQQAAAKQAQKGSGVGPSISRVLAANDPTRTAKAITGRVAKQAEDVRAGLADAAEKFKVAKESNEAAAKKVFDAAGNEIQGNTATPTTEGASAGAFTYGGPQNLNVSSSVLNRLKTIGNTGQLGATAGGRQQLVQSQFASSGRPYSKGSSILDAMLLGQGGSKDLMGMQLEAAKLTSDTAREQKAAESQASSAEQNINQRREELNKLLTGSVDKFKAGTQQALDTVIEKIKSGKATKEEMAQAGLNLGDQDYIEDTPEFWEKIKDNLVGFANKDRFGVLNKYLDSFKRVGEGQNVLKALGATKVEDLGKAPTDIDEFSDIKNKGKVFAASANEEANQAVKRAANDSQSWKAMLSGANMIDPSTKVNDPNIVPTINALNKVAFDLNKPHIMDKVKAASSKAAVAQDLVNRAWQQLQNAKGQENEGSYRQAVEQYQLAERQAMNEYSAATQSARDELMAEANAFEKKNVTDVRANVLNRIMGGKNFINRPKTAPQAAGALTAQDVADPDKVLQDFRNMQDSGNKTVVAAGNQKRITDRFGR